MSVKKTGVWSLVCILILGGACGLLQAEQQSKEILSLHAPKERMQWWNEQKFGLFIHWGPWSQTSIGAIWQIVKKDAPDVREKRFELYKTFNPTEFNPRQWAQLARQAGMRYVVFTTKHHDGFCNFDTKWTDLKITNPQCPYSRSENPDIVRQIVDAFRQEGLAIGHYYSHIDWHHPAGKYFSKRHWQYDEGLIDKDPQLWHYFATFEKGQVRELLTNYGPVDIFWFDITWPSARRFKDSIVKHRFENPLVKKDVVDMVKMMRTLAPGLIINNRGVDAYGDFDTPEQRIPKKTPQGPWETNMTISDPHRRKAGGYWYNGPDAKYKSLDELLRVMAEVFSKGGNFLLNVGPRPDGKIPDGEAERLRQIGQWMKTNGEAVYGTERSPLPSAPEWGYITRKGQCLYMIVFDWPKKGETLPLTLKNKIKKAWLIKDNTPVSFTRKADGTVVELALPASAPDEVASVVAVEFEGPPDVASRSVAQR